MSLPVFLALLIACSGYALIRGGAPERIAAALQVGAFLAGLTLHVTIEPSDYRSILTGTAAIDLVLLVCLFALADRSARWWPILLAGWQLAAVLAHVGRALDTGMMRVGYAVETQIWAYPMLIAMAIGAWRHRRRQARTGIDPDWKAQLA